jgi:RNA polymerase sigma-70 factor (ECF subfamily)
MADDVPATTKTIRDWLKDPLAHPEGWKAFAERYWAPIKKWCLQKGLQECDAEDIASKLVLKFQSRIESFPYDPSRGRFRDWLHGVTVNACNDFFGAKADALEKWRKLVKDFKAKLNQRIEALPDLAIYHIALSRVQEQVSERDWEIFIGGRRARELAAEFGLTVGTIYNIRHAINQMLKDEVEKLGGHMDSGSEPS